MTRATSCLVLLALLATGCSDDGVGDGACRSGEDCPEDGESVSCRLPGSCESGVGPCEEPRCQPGAEVGFDGTCEALACDAANDACPDGSTCTPRDCDGVACDACSPDPATCAANEDCPAGYACDAGACFQGCRTAEECASPNEICEALECVPKPCSIDGDCGDGFCLAGGCYDTLGRCASPPE